MAVWSTTALCNLMLVHFCYALRSYEKSAPLDQEKVTFSWTIEGDKAELLLVITDPSVVRKNASALWLGVGIGDPQSGGMLGADIATAVFEDPSASDSCVLADRHVKSVGYPLDSSDGGDAVYPDEDACGKSDWKLVSCAIDSTNGKMTLELDRPLKAGNRQEDRDIDKSRNIIIAAWGGGFGYHDANRQSIVVDMTKSGKDAVGSFSLKESGRVPKDATKSQKLTVGNFTVAADATVYACNGFLIDVPEGGVRRQIVAIEPVVDLATEVGSMVHHFVLYSCSKIYVLCHFSTFDLASKNEVFERARKESIDCHAQDFLCRDVVFAWAKGFGPVVMPDVAGFPVSEDERFFNLEVHYDNPKKRSGVVDSSSGVIIHTTDTPRKFDAGTINIGDPKVGLVGDKVQSKVNYTISCPSECTSQLAGPLTIYSSFLHSHTTGKQMWTNLYREGEPVKTIEATAYWSDENQRPTLFEETELRPGDKLVIGANYDTSKRDARGDDPVVWGAGTSDEMFMSFIFVYPRPLKASGKGAVSYCGYAGPGVTGCNDGATFEQGVDILAIPALSIGKNVEDEGFRTEFGGKAQCQVDEKKKNGTSSDDDSTCFPAQARVQLRDGTTKRMDELSVGDHVLVSRGIYSPIFMFTHKLSSSSAEYVFVEITTRSGHTLRATPGHYIPTADGDLVPARSLSVGDRVSLGSGKMSEVVAVGHVSDTGLYNPQTLHGNLVVDGVVATTYTSAIAPTVAHAGLAPLRTLFRLFGVSLRGSILERRASEILSCPPWRTFC